jgi:1,4-alpha-glucan branching enzyme
VIRNDALGFLSIVLHAHLPFIRHPEHRYHLEENWLHEAVVATYLPLLEAFRDMARDGVQFRVTMSMSPPLCAMLADPLLQQRTLAYLDRLVRLGELELDRTEGDAALHRAATFYLERFTRLRALYTSLDGDLLGAFAALWRSGHVELVTVCATHGFLPVIREPAARRAQIAVAVESHTRHLGAPPRGIWLAECGYTDGVDALLAEHDIRFFFVDSHGVLNARPRPPMGVHAPVYTTTGVAAFARDMESSKQVWSANEGYPGDPFYRDFYRDIGFDLPLDVIGPFVHPDGIRVHTGYKYHRVTGNVDLGHKAIYDPRIARERAAEHAGHFMWCRQRQIDWLGKQHGRRPIVLAPYDAELYGHWWFEGPMFLEFLLRKIHFDQSALQTVTPIEYLEAYPQNPACEVNPSSWGDGGYGAVWIDQSNDWMYPHVHRAEADMVALAHRYPGADGVRRRALDQAARELLLLQSSDWAFIIRNKTAVEYAENRVKAHIARFRRLHREIEASAIDEAWLAGLESRDNIFPGLDYRVYAR